MSIATSPFKKSVCKILLNIPPCFSTDIQKGIRTKLDRLLLRYVPHLDGVLTSYHNIRLLQRKGRIMYDCPFLHIWIRVEMIHFSPAIGSCIVGEVNKQGPDHIGLLAFGIFNVSIPATAIPKSFVWHHSEHAWVKRDTGEVVESGCHLRFTVSRVFADKLTISLGGSLLESGSGFYIPASLAEAQGADVITSDILVEPLHVHEDMSTDLKTKKEKKKRKAETSVKDQERKLVKSKKEKRIHAQEVDVGH